MAITERQYSHLQAMNIPLWIRKGIAQSGENTQALLAVEIDFEKLSKSMLFQDILRYLDISIAEVTKEQTHLNLGLFNWQFTQDNQINFDHNLLTTPSIELIAKEPKLKHQLLAIFIEHNLLCQ